MVKINHKSSSFDVAVAVIVADAGFRFVVLLVVSVPFLNLASCLSLSLCVCVCVCVPLIPFLRDFDLLRYLVYGRYNTIIVSLFRRFCFSLRFTSFFFCFLMIDLSICSLTIFWILDFMMHLTSHIRSRQNLDFPSFIFFFF